MDTSGQGLSARTEGKERQNKTLVSRSMANVKRCQPSDLWGTRAADFSEELADLAGASEGQSTYSENLIQARGQLLRHAQLWIESADWSARNISLLVYDHY